MAEFIGKVSDCIALFRQKTEIVHNETAFFDKKTSIKLRKSSSDLYLYYRILIEVYGILIVF